MVGPGKRYCAGWDATQNGGAAPVIPRPLDLLPGAGHRARTEGRRSGRRALLDRYHRLGRGGRDPRVRAGRTPGPGRFIPVTGPTMPPRPRSSRRRANYGRWCRRKPPPGAAHAASDTFIWSIRSMARAVHRRPTGTWRVVSGAPVLGSVNATRSPCSGAVPGRIQPSGCACRQSPASAAQAQPDPLPALPGVSRRQPLHPCGTGVSAGCRSSTRS